MTRLANHVYMCWQRGLLLTVYSLLFTAHCLLVTAYCLLVYIFAREDDYFFGVLHSKLHELWALRMGTWLGKGNDPRYTPTSTFEPFPFPWAPNDEPASHPNKIAGAEFGTRQCVIRNDHFSID